MATNPNLVPSDLLAAPAYYIRGLSEEYAGLATDILRSAIGNANDARTYYENSVEYKTFGAITLGNELIGMAAVRYSYLSDEVGAELKHLATIPRYQKGFGIGSRLLKVVEDDAKNRGAKKLTLTAYSNAWGFYAEKGYSNPSKFPPKPMEFEKSLEDSS